jgi:hypothetical protein
MQAPCSAKRSPRRRSIALASPGDGRRAKGTTRHRLSSRVGLIRTNAIYVITSLSEREKRHHLQFATAL